MIGDVLRSIFRRPATVHYPAERRPTASRLRGLLTWNRAKCSGCRLCAMDCPANAVEVITLDKKAKRFVLRYHVDRCIYCAQCVQNCRFGCLEMSPTAWELAALNREAFEVTYGDEADINAWLAGATEADKPADQAG
jgi:formate hydrogenlyase subunit 6/NADH:ubiquinone oxidoreductase subunit I